MSNRFQRLVAWTLLAQVMLVGGLGTGLHGLLGCDHGPADVCTASCCAVSDDAASCASCDNCAFCRRAVEKQSAAASRAASDRSLASVTAAGCDGCAVCDLLAQYHSVTPFELDSLSIELSTSEAAIHQHNAVVAAATRLALSRGPPAV